MVVCTVKENQLHIEFSFDSRILGQEAVRRMAQQFEQVLRNLCSQRTNNIRVCNVRMITDLDLNQIWKWNSEPPETVLNCVHDLITEVAHNQPNSTAVSAWNGELTYKQLNLLSSIIGCHLIEMGVKPNMIVLLCFEKSMWMPIAFLSVLKVGGAGLLLDPTLPQSRLETILQQVQPRIILSSVANRDLSSKLVAKTLTLSADMDLIRNYEDVETACFERRLPYVKPSDLLYVIFTTGSTGIPKGCMIQHQDFSSAMSHQRGVLRLNSSSRVYDFSSYAFDGAHWSAFHVFAAGGILCIPSTEERSNYLTESIRRFFTTDIFLTPATARLIDPIKIPTLRSIYIGGEVVSREDLAPWVSCTNTRIVYGPTECSATSLYWSVPSSISSELSISNGVGLSTWVVDPLSVEELSPIGAVGELYLEGPLVGQGYLEDKEKTRLSFIKDPSWLLEGAPDCSMTGRRGRLYKTGDLVRYNPTNGTIIFIGRRDTQMKLRGQRIELSEVEYHVRHCLSSRLKALTVIAEVITPKVIERPTLVVFIQVKEDEKLKLDEIVNTLDVELPKRLPSFMIPTAYIPIEDIPLTAGGKTNRMRLQDIGTYLTLEQLNHTEGHSIGKSPTTGVQSHLRLLWEAILGVPAEKLGTDSNFLRFGGDSIAAMRVAALARSRGIFLMVQNILQAPRLSEMAKTVEMVDPDSTAYAETVPPFSLLHYPANKEIIIDQVVRMCDTDASNVEDVFPCTGVQKSLLSITAKRPGDYVAIFELKLRENVDVDRLKQAWEHISRSKAPILRCRIVDIPVEGLVQVQLNEPLE